MVISEEDWKRLCKLQWKSTCSTMWREFSWKNRIRFFITPLQKRHQGNGVGCWRLCGLNEANHLHVFWECPLLVPYWREIHKNLEAIFGVNIPFKCDTLYLGNIPFEMWNSDDRKLMLILLVASKKAITRKWLKPKPPKVDEWIDIIHDIYIMEKLCFSLRIQKEKFLRIWPRWTEYVKPIRSDFFFNG